jgi:hypothetical protein
MQMKKSLQETILEQLDSICKRGDFFPFIHSWHNLFGPCRLVAYRSAEEWLITIQTVTFSNRLGDFVTYLWAFGNILTYNGLHEFEDGRLHIPVPETDWYPDPAGFSFRLDQKLCMIESAETLSRVRRINSGSPDYDAIYSALMVISLTYSSHHLLFSNEYVLEFLKKPQDWHPFVQVDAWQNISRQQFPSQNSCYVSLAQALALGDHYLFVNDPTLINTSLSTIPSIWD